MKMWPARQEMNGDFRMEVVVRPGRTQVVNVSMARDPDNDVVAFVWSRAGDMNVARDPMRLLQHNAQLTYGKVAIRGADVVVVHGLLDSAANLQEVGKTIFYVAKAADELEQATYGAYTDTQ